MNDVQVTVGTTASINKTFSESDISTYADITGDINPLHVDDAYCKRTRFKHRLVHGTLLAGLVSTILGTKLPGPGTIMVEQSAKHLKPTYIGDTVTATVKVVNINDRRVHLQHWITNARGETVLEGTAVVSPPRLLP